MTVLQEARHSLIIENDPMLYENAADDDRIYLSCHEQMLPKKRLFYSIRQEPIHSSKSLLAMQIESGASMRG
jgi:hypothetical protein